MKYYQIINLFIVGLMVFVSSCDENFEEVNSNPNQPEEVSPAAILPGIIRGSVNASVEQSFLVGNNAAQLTAKALRQQVDLYNWNAFSNLAWDPLYDVLRDVESLEKVAVEQGSDNYRAASLIMKSWIFSVLTDAYGDIPYSQAIGADEDINFPRYDPQEDIYLGTGSFDGLLDNLQKANNFLDAGGDNLDGDILFNGDIAKWKKFCNSLRLRLLLRVANKDPEFAQNQMQEIVDQNMIMASYEDNAVLKYLESPPNQFPTRALKTGDFDAVEISQRLVTQLKDIADPRLTVYARPRNEPIPEGDDPIYAGRPNGVVGSAQSGSLLGYEYFDYAQHNTVSERPDGIIMTNAEVQFILAEAEEKGWISTNQDPEDYYRAGIQSGMRYYGVYEFPYSTSYGNTTFASFDEYYNQPGVDLSQASDKLERIAGQKWIALFFTGIQPWLEWKRTGFPDLQPTPDNANNDQIPKRFLYPGSEQNLNGDNYRQAVESMGGDNINQTTWWDDV